MSLLSSQANLSMLLVDSIAFLMNGVPFTNDNLNTFLHVQLKEIGWAAIRGHGKNPNCVFPLHFYRSFLTAVHFYRPITNTEIYIKCTSQLVKIRFSLCGDTFPKYFWATWARLFSFWETSLSSNELLGNARLFTSNCWIMLHSLSRLGSRGNKEIPKKLFYF